MADAPDYSGSAMLALYPPPALAGRLALPGGLASADLHCTLAYVGDAANVDPQALFAAACSLTARAPITGSIAGHARFTGGEQDVLVALVDSANLEDLRAAALDALAAAGVAVPREHGYTAHITRLYAAPDDGGPGARLPAEPVTFTALSVVHGEHRTDLPFTGAPAPDMETTRAEDRAIAPYARTAYGQGWAASGGPMTDRVRAGCVAAVDYAVEHAHESGVLEVTLHLGHLEGVWAAIFERREKLIARHARLVAAAWKQAAAALDPSKTVRDLRTRLGLGEAVDPNTAASIAAAVTAAATLLAWLPGTTAWQALRYAMRDALRSGRAEGAADAIVLAADAAGRVGIGFDLAFRSAYDALANLGTLWSDADGWLGKILDRGADQLGRALAALAADGADYQDMLAAAQDILDGAAGDAVSFTVDWALNTALARGALDLYASEGVPAASWVTAGDGRVCPTCQDNEDGSPYPLTDFPSMPDHPRCRCVAVGDFTLPASYDALFTDA